MEKKDDLCKVWPPTPSVAKAAGHEPMSPLKAIRLKCKDCCCGKNSEVELCQATTCALWPFRAGKHPYTSAAYAKDET